ncbi:hypothetical protein GCM10017653_33640 [Ancylobacter defluvii]|uniref:Uncharacterized protein n=1 Tax=Ancylobacter defluvii TaxID=1282440 RepID=A0A9W6K0H8_9HYPH|nr:hypothetical protein GCM10017653_33640 [Ancylobacter defluvii]
MTRHRGGVVAGAPAKGIVCGGRFRRYALGEDRCRVVTLAMIASLSIAASTVGVAIRVPARKQNIF